MTLQPLKIFVLFSLLISSYSALASLPDKLIFAAIPQYVEQFEQNKLGHNIVMQLGKELNVEVELYPCPWVRCLKLIETGQADIIDDLFKTKDRQSYIRYLSPEFEVQTAGFRFYSTTSSISSFADLKSKTVGHLRGYKHFERFEKATNFNKVSLLDLKDMVNMMLAERIDVFIAPPSFDLEDIAPFDTERKIQRQPYDVIIDMPLYLGVSKQSQWAKQTNALEQALKKALAQSN